MQLSSICLFLFSLVALVAAAPGPNAERLARGLNPLPPRQFSPSKVDSAKRATSSSSPPSQCNTGSTVCCKSDGHANDGPIALLLGLLGIIVKDLTLLIGSNCSPLTVGGTGSGATCKQQPLCCENNSFGGLIAIGCSPINLNL